MPAYFRFESSVAPEFVSPEVVTKLAVHGNRIGRSHGSGYLTTTGFAGAVAAMYSPDLCRPNCHVAANLRAVYYGLQKVTATEVVVLTDNRETAFWLRNWRFGKTNLPRWYDSAIRGDGKRPTITKLRDIVNDRGSDLKVLTARPHSGFVLNEAADALAGIGSNVVNGVYDKASGQERVIRIATTFLDTYKAQQQG